MASLIDLLLYKKEVELINPVNNKPIKKVWVRVLGDFDLTRAYKVARIASSKKRLALRDPNTEDYQDEVISVKDLTREEKEDIIKTAKTTAFIAEGQSSVEREDLPKIEEVAIDPDAAGLEDLETLDKREKEIDESYRKRLQEYIETRLKELNASLEAKTEDEITDMAMYEISNVMPFSIFMNELAEQKILLGTFRDKSCKEKEFDSVEDIKNLPKLIKDQLTEAISALEVSYDEIKN
jgi:hypothetical protein